MGRDRSLATSITVGHIECDTVPYKLLAQISAARSASMDCIEDNLESPLLTQQPPMNDALRTCEDWRKWQIPQEQLRVRLPIQTA